MAELLARVPKAVLRTCDRSDREASVPDVDSGLSPPGGRTLAPEHPLGSFQRLAPPNLCSVPSGLSSPVCTQ